MCQSISDENPLLMGLSFGGMMAIEMAKIIPVKKLVLISTVKNRNELPRWIKCCGYLKLNKIFPLKSYKIFEPIQNYNLGVATEEEKIMVRNFRKNVQQVYLDWAINEILNWKNNWQPSSYIHINGDNDRIFSAKKIKHFVCIKNGGHFMIMNMAAEISTQILSYINR